MANDPLAETDPFRAISMSQMTVSRAYRRACIGCGHELHHANACPIRPTLSRYATETCACPVERESVTDRHVIGAAGR